MKLLLRGKLKAANCNHFNTAKNKLLYNFFGKNFQHILETLNIPEAYEDWVNYTDYQAILGESCAKSRMN